MLEAGDLDLVLVTDQGRGRDPLRGQDCPLVWVAAPEFDVARGGALPVAFMPPGCEFRRAGLSALELACRDWTLVMSSPSPTGLRVAVETGLAVTVLPEVALGVPRMQIASAARGMPALGRVRAVAHATKAVPDPVVAGLAEQLRLAMQGWLRLSGNGAAVVDAGGARAAGSRSADCGKGLITSY